MKIYVKLEINTFAWTLNISCGSENLYDRSGFPPAHRYIVTDVEPSEHLSLLQCKQLPSNFSKISMWQNLVSFARYNLLKHLNHPWCCYYSEWSYPTCKNFKFGNYNQKDILGSFSRYLNFLTESNSWKRWIITCPKLNRVQVVIAINLRFRRNF